MQTTLDRLRFLVQKLASGKYTVFAKSCNIPLSTFKTYYDGQSKPNSEQLEKIYSVYKVNLNWLLVGQGEPFIQAGGEGKTSEAGQVVHIDAAVQLLREAEEETGITLNPAQRQSILPILRKNLDEDRRNVKKLISAFWGGKGKAD